MAQKKPKMGPKGPKKSAGGKSGTNKPTPYPSAGTSGMGHQSSMCP